LDLKIVNSETNQLKTADSLCLTKSALMLVSSVFSKCYLHSRKTSH